MMVSKAGRVLVLGELTVEWERHNEPIAACVERKMEGEGGKFQQAVKHLDMKVKRGVGQEMGFLALFQVV